MKKVNNNVLIIAVVLVMCAVFGLAYISNRDNDIQENTVSSGYVNKESSDYKTFSEIKGEEYDQTFLTNMVAHHEGAVDMAKLAQTNAQHQELKDMANDIITAQTKEIADMQSWQKKWDYPVNTDGMMMDHSAMGMMDEMSTMTDSLKDLKGEEFDKVFLSTMIEHHKSAINMAYPGLKNAKHKEVKELVANIISAQSKEIGTMQQWQSQWGYVKASE